MGTSDLVLLCLSLLRLQIRTTEISLVLRAIICNINGKDTQQTHRFKAQ